MDSPAMKSTSLGVARHLSRLHSSPRMDPEASATQGSATAHKAVIRRRWKLALSYFSDWVVTLLIVGIFLGLERTQGFRRRFSLTDETIQFPYALKERVPDWLLYLCALVIPAVLMPVTNLFTTRNWWDFHNSELGLILALSLSGTVIQILKIATGRPRPDLIDRCQPAVGATNPPVYGLVDFTICTQTDVSIMRDGWRSFASGHSALSFAGLGFLSLYWAGKLHLFDRAGVTIKAWFALLPLLGALVIALTRSMDYRHHWQDIIVGIITGLIFAYFSYRQYYPSLAHPLSHRPYGPRFPIPNAEHPWREDAGNKTLSLGGEKQTNENKDLEQGKDDVTSTPQENRNPEDDEALRGTLRRDNSMPAERR